MYPYLLQAGSFSIPSYTALYGLGVASAGIIMLVMARREGLPVRTLAHLILLLTVVILVGGRTFYVLQHLREFQGRPALAIDLSQGGQVLYGGFLLSAPVFWCYCAIARLPRGVVGDLVAVASPLGIAIGRVGCFCRGCCYGRITDVAWAVRFPKFIDTTGEAVGSPAFIAHLDRELITESALMSVPVHPAQVYASTASLLLFAIMLWLWRSGQARGYLLVVYATAYAASRFVLETFRDNEMAFWGLTVPQVVSLIIFFVGLSVLILLRWRVPRPQTA